MNSSLLPFMRKPFQNVDYSYKKVFAPREEILSFKELIPVEKEGENANDRVNKFIALLCAEISLSF